MLKKVFIIVFTVLVCCIAMATYAFIKKETESNDNPYEMIDRIEKALGEDFKKQSMTELAATLEYGNEDGSNKIYYRILKTTYYEADPTEVTGLHTEALNVLFPVDLMESCEEMMIQDWYGALYKKDDIAYLCWTYDPEVTYVLEYNPSQIPDSEILKMAQSAEVME